MSICHFNQRKFVLAIRLDARTVRFSVLFSVPAAASTSLGISYTIRNTCGIGSKLTFTAFALFLTIYFLSFIFLEAFATKKKVRAASKERPKPKHLYVKILCLLIIAWLPYFLATFPGLYTYDAIPQTTRAICMGIIDSWHTLSHTYWLTGCMYIGKIFLNSYQLGLSLYTLSQYLLFAILLAFFNLKIYALSKANFTCLISTLFMAFFPVFPIMAVSSTKDTIFSASFAVFAISLLNFCKDGFKFNNKSDAIMLLISGVMLSNFRNNGYYALVLMVLIFILATIKKTFSRKLWIALIMVSTITSLIIPKVISQRSSGATEVLGLPMQQICCAATSNSSELSEDEINNLDRVIPGWRNYYPAISDAVKFSDGTQDAISSNLLEFLQIWIHYLRKYPLNYLDATIAMVNCWINPFAAIPTGEINHPYLEFDSYEIYNEKTLVRHWPDHDDFLGYNVELVIQVDRLSLLPQFTNIVRNFCYNPPWYSNKIFRVATSTGLLILIGYYCLIMSIYRRETSTAFFFVLVFLYLLTCLLGPVYLVRYALPFYILEPLFVYLAAASVKT